MNQELFNSISEIKQRKSTSMLVYQCILTLSIVFWCFNYFPFETGKIGIVNTNTDEKQGRNTNHVDKLFLEKERKDVHNNINNNNVQQLQIDPVYSVNIILIIRSNLIQKVQLHVFLFLTERNLVQCSYKRKVTKRISNNSCFGVFLQSHYRTEVPRSTNQVQAQRRAISNYRFRRLPASTNCWCYR